MKLASLTRRLTLTVLVLEVLSAFMLIGAITVHERHMQLQAFDATLRGTADSLLGAVQDAEDEGDNVMLDMRGIQLSNDAIFRVEDERGRVLGSSASAPKHQAASDPSGKPVFEDKVVDGRNYRLVTIRGMRIIDPGQPNGGIRHGVTVVYGAPVGRVWHEVLEAVRFFAIATAILLGLSALAMVWLLRRGLSPLHALTRAADHIDSTDWHFEAPYSAKTTLELRPLALALEGALARLQRSFEQQKRFTSDAAHELKTDVAIVKSSLQLLSMRKRTVEEYSRGLALSLDDFTRLEMTVHKMLTLARLEQHTENASLQACSLRDVIEEAVHQSSPFAELRGVKVQIQTGDDVQIPVGRHDALLLCSNVLLNALQHSPTQTTVRIGVVNENHGICLTISDEGYGIANEDRPYLFEPFYRGDPSRSRKSGGTGLGLAICRAICHRAGGSIEIVNGPAGGALVTILLPAK